ncbi:MAG TPA: hypothetical protein VKJ47_17095 [Candidatus Binatia bacterium]|nr:hypothetical protein [Candidatus Binatia bacterium]
MMYATACPQMASAEGPPRLRGTLVLWAQPQVASTSTITPVHIRKVEIMASWSAEHWG